MFDPAVRRAIRKALLEGLRQEGRTIGEIAKARGIPGNPEEVARAGEPVWHELAGLRDFVVGSLSLDGDAMSGNGWRRRTVPGRGADLNRRAGTRETGPAGGRPRGTRENPTGTGPKGRSRCA